eukprot:6491138-Amphidinium_carterae.3
MAGSTFYRTIKGVNGFPSQSDAQSICDDPLVSLNTGQSSEYPSAGKVSFIASCGLSQEGAR